MTGILWLAGAVGLGMIALLVVIAMSVDSTLADIANLIEEINGKQSGTTED